MKKQNARGFTLIEIMVVVVIFGILSSIAVGSYENSRKKSRRSDGQNSLFEAATLMEKYFFNEKTYTTDLAAIGYSTLSANVPSLKGHYTISVNPETPTCPISSCYEIQATAIGIQTDDQDLTLDSRGRKTPTTHW